MVLVSINFSQLKKQYIFRQDRAQNTKTDFLFILDWYRRVSISSEVCSQTICNIFVVQPFVDSLSKCPKPT